MNFDVYFNSVQNISNINLNINKQATHLSIFDWSAADFDAINNFLFEIDSNLVFGYNFDVDSIWNAFKCTIWPIIYMFVPRKAIPHHQKYRPRMYPKQIRKLLTKKSAIWRALEFNKSSELLSHYHSISEACRLEIFKFNSEREEKLLKANNLGAFYKFVNKKLTRKYGMAPFKNKDNTLITEDIYKANLLNDHFLSVFTTNDGTLPPFPSRLASANIKISDIRISPEIIGKILKKL